MKSGKGGKGGKITDKKRAIAIALSEARKVGQKITAKSKTKNKNETDRVNEVALRLEKT